MRLLAQRDGVLRGSGGRPPPRLWECFFKSLPADEETLLNYKTNMQHDLSQRVGWFKMGLQHTAKSTANWRATVGPGADGG
jgi:hypothetical protein